MSKVWVMSDLHFNHRNICNFRKQFSSVEEHNETLMDNILATITKRDTLWLLGDCFFDTASVEYARVISENCGYVHWVLGNHDTDNTFRQRAMKHILIEGLFAGVYGVAKKNGIWLTHCPIHTDELRGGCNIHGHTHNHNIDDSRYFNASCENVDYRPKSFQEIKSILRGE